MNENQTFLGFWCLSEKGNLKNCQSLPGELTITSDFDISLKLMCEPNQLQVNLFNINEQEFIPVIIGFAKNTRTNNDHNFTLIDSIVSGYRSDSLTEIELTSEKVLIDHQIENLNDFKIGNISLHVKFLEEWVGVSGFSRVNPLSSNDDRVKLEYLKPLPIPILTNNKLKIEIRFAARAPYFPLFKDVTFSETAFVNIEFNRRQNLSTVFKLIERIGNFFTLAIGEPVPVDLIKMSMHSYKQQNRENIKHEPKFQMIKKEYKKYTTRTSIRKDSMLFPLSIIQANCSNLIAFWIDYYDKFRPALNLYFGKIYSNSQYQENAFLDIVYSLEVLHRVQNPNFDGKNRRYYETLNKILEKHKQNEKMWLLKRLNRKEEKTLMNRFEDLYEVIKPVVNTIFSDPVKSFERIVTTRNFLVHYDIDNRRRRKIIPTNKLYMYTNKLTVVFQALLVYYLTGDLNIVIDRIDKSTINKIYIRYENL